MYLIKSGSILLIEVLIALTVMIIMVTMIAQCCCSMSYTMHEIRQRLAVINKTHDFIELFVLDQHKPNYEMVPLDVDTSFKWDIVRKRPRIIAAKTDTVDIARLRLDNAELFHVEARWQSLAHKKDSRLCFVAGKMHIPGEHA